MTRNGLAILALSIAPLAAMPGAASAQSVLGSGVAPATVDNSAERPIAFATAMPADAANAVVMTSADLPALAASLPADTAARIAAADFTGADGQTLALPAPAGGRPIMLFGAANADGEPIDWRVVGARIAREFQGEDAAIAIAGLPSGEAMAMAALGASLGQYRFDRYKSDRSAPPVQPITLVGSAAAEARAQWGSRQAHLAEGVRLARDLVNEPANVIYPASFVDRARAALAGAPNVTIEVLDEADFRRLGMGAIAGVGQGSPRGSRMMVVTYRGADGPPIALAGKGITFDSGGISLKPGTEMDEMKYDMCGAAGVLGTLQAIAEMELGLNVVGVIPSAENLPSGKAAKPGDIVTSMSGQSIEILNTDAEGRLVLCDALTYAAKFKPDTVIDLATLTGACVIALGHVASGLFSNDDKLAADLLAAGAETHDRAWQLPLWDDYQPLLDSNFADMQNIGGRAGGTITAACFLSRFTKDYRWAHLDIAGTAWLSGKEKGGTGRPVPLLTQYLINRSTK